MTTTSNNVLQNFIAQFFVKGLTDEEAKEQGINGEDFDFAFDNRLKKISSKIEKVVNYFVQNGVKMTQEQLNTVFHKTEVVQKDVYDYKTDTTTRENRVVEAGIVQKGFCVGFTQPDEQNCQYGVFCDHKNIYAFRRFNGNGAILSAYVMSF